jgi:hypothetical protein
MEYPKRSQQKSYADQDNNGHIDADIKWGVLARG